jgi:hypothetical protein
MTETPGQLSALMDELDEALDAAEETETTFHVRQAMQHAVSIQEFDTGN